MNVALAASRLKGESERIGFEYCTSWGSTASLVVGSNVSAEVELTIDNI
jgi:hypothetical protein